MFMLEITREEYKNRLLLSKFFFYFFRYFLARGLNKKSIEGNSPLSPVHMYELMICLDRARGLY